MTFQVFQTDLLAQSLSCSLIHGFSFSSKDFCRLFEGPHVILLYFFSIVLCNSLHYAGRSLGGSFRPWVIYGRDN